MGNTSYVHGYSEREALRLNDQAQTLDELIHFDSVFPKGSRILEAGCGVGAQTAIMAKKNPDAHFVSVDISAESIKEAQITIAAENLNNVELKQGDIFNLPFSEESFDAIVLCFVLEHLPNPSEAINKLLRSLKKGGIFIAIEGDHGSTYFFPDSKEAHEAINCQVTLQKESGGNSNIGRELYPLLRKSGLSNIQVSPRMVYVDASKPELVEGFIKNTFTAMIEGVKSNAVAKGLMDKSAFDKGIRDLYRTAEPDGVFCYTFFKVFATK
jgi:ubiquinone/menaquinone biosynthesis C-methylase UbiE